MTVIFTVKITAIVITISSIALVFEIFFFGVADIRATSQHCRTASVCLTDLQSADAGVGLR